MKQQTIIQLAQGPRKIEISIIIKQVLKYQPGDLDDDTLEEMNKKHSSYASGQDLCSK